MVTTAIVLAGGLGTRLRAAVPDLPKPMAPVAGRPFLEHLMAYWHSQGIERFILSVGYRHEAIESHFGTRYRDATVEYAIETEPLGTGGAVLLAARGLATEQRFLLLNGDTYFAASLRDLHESAVRWDADWCFSVFRSDDTERYMGMALSTSGQVISLRADQATVGQRVNGGVYCVHPRSLRRLEGRFGARFSLENDFLPAAHASGQRLFALECAGTFIDIGIPADYRRAADVICGTRVPGSSDAGIDTQGEPRNA